MNATAAASMRSANVELCLADDAPLTLVSQLYGGGGALLAALRHGAAAWLSCDTPDGNTDEKESDEKDKDEALLRILLHVQDFSAAGGLSDDAATRDRMSEALLSIVQRAVSAPSPRAAAAARVIDVASRCLSNCAGGTARHAADLQLRVGPLRINVGFADYADGETGARLWAGAVGLALFVAERHAAPDLQRWGRCALGNVGTEAAVCTVGTEAAVGTVGTEAAVGTVGAEAAGGTVGTEAAGGTIRAVEIGCGPALVSLLVAHLCAAESPHAAVAIDATDISPAVVAEARRSFAQRNGPAVAEMFERGDARVFALDFARVPEALYAQYDVVLGSDIVYDFGIAAHVAPAIARLLRPGGVAYLCCERHRDGMESFLENVRGAMTDVLDVVETYNDVQEALREFKMIPGLSTTTCALMVLRRK